MSDNEEVTRKLPGGKKVVEKITATVSEETNEASTSSNTRVVVKKRKLADGDIRSLFGGNTAAAPTEDDDSTVLPKLKGTVANTPAEEAIMELEKTLGEDWYELLKDEFQQGYFKAIRNRLIAESRKGSIVYPSTENIFSWSRLTPLDSVKVIILGQDPYHGPKQAHGLSFSVMEPTKPPPSLVNIYKELKNSIPGFVIPKSGNLTPLAEAGVLWLNTSLTVRANEAGSHSKIGWQIFTKAVIEAAITRRPRGIVFMLWGSHAQKAVEGIPKGKNKFLKSVHPSPLSASKGWFGSNHFAQANTWLKDTYGPEEQVDWKAICPK